VHKDVTKTVYKDVTRTVHKDVTKSVPKDGEQKTVKKDSEAASCGSGCRQKIEPQPGWQEALDRDLTAAAAAQDSLPEAALPSAATPTSRDEAPLRQRQSPPAAAPQGAPKPSGPPPQESGRAASLTPERPVEAISAGDGTAGNSTAAGEGNGRAAGRNRVQGSDGRRPPGSGRGSGASHGDWPRKRRAPEAPTGLDALAAAAGLADGGAAEDEPQAEDGGEERRDGTPPPEAGVGSGQAAEGGGAERGESGPGVRRPRLKLTCPECGGSYRQGDLVRHKNTRSHKVAVLDKAGLWLSRPR
jgi:hypothetical protein